jgi:hypothetical protein
METHDSAASVALENWKRMVSSILGDSGTGVMQEAGRAFVGNIGSGRRGHLDAHGELDDLCSPHPEWLNHKVSLSKALSSSFAASHVHMVSKNARTATRTTALDAAWTSESSFLGRMVIDPEGNKRLLWTSFGALLLLYDTLTIPLEAISLWNPPMEAICFHLVAYRCCGFTYRCWLCAFTFQRSSSGWAHGATSSGIPLGATGSTAEVGTGGEDRNAREHFRVA